MSEGRSRFRWVDASGGPPAPGELASIRRHLDAGGLIAYPTETVYGFGCLLRERALSRLRELKEREPERPFLLLTAGRASTSALRWTDAARALADAFWPGPLTLVLEDPSAVFPASVRGRESGGVAVRDTSHPVARALCESAGEPLTSTSANRPSRRPAGSATDAARAAGLLGAGEDEMWIIDGGSLPPSEPSTIVDCTGRELVVVREGAIPVRRLVQTSDTAVGEGER